MYIYILNGWIIWKIDHVLTTLILILWMCINVNAHDHMATLSQTNIACMQQGNPETRPKTVRFASACMRMGIIDNIVYMEDMNSKYLVFYFYFLYYKLILSDKKLIPSRRTLSVYCPSLSHPRFLASSWKYMQLLIIELAYM